MLDQLTSGLLVQRVKRALNELELRGQRCALPDVVLGSFVKLGAVDGGLCLCELVQLQDTHRVVLLGAALVVLERGVGPYNFGCHIKTSLNL